MTEQFNDIVIIMSRIELAGVNFFDCRSKVGSSIHVFTAMASPEPLGGGR